MLIRHCYPVSPSTPVVRIATRRAKPGCAPAYEALLAGMFEDVKTHPGFVGAQIIPPAEPGGEYQVVLQFETEAGIEAWNRSPERGQWHARLDAVAEGEPEYRQLSGLEAWFARAEVPGHTAPARWKMAVVTWFGIFPTVALVSGLLGPRLAGWPFAVRTAVTTVVIVLLMTWLVMPRMVRLFRRWLAP
jgi:antibiotic biosynthesis monooxygenase (ABM) superfamily enzyme